MKKLTYKEFYDVYGISLILRHATDAKTVAFLATIINDIAHRYLEITTHAVISELRHFPEGCEPIDTDDDYVLDMMANNLALLKKLKIKKWSVAIKKISLATATDLFNSGDWDSEYGGKAWGRISKTAENLKQLLPVTTHNIKKVILTIDRLNDLEHNNSLYMSEYCTFCYETALDNKAGAKADNIIRHCSKEVRDLYKDNNLGGIL